MRAETFISNSAKRAILDFSKWEQGLSWAHTRKVPFPLFK